MTWPVSLLGEVAQRLDYGVTASARDQDVGPKFLRITDIQDGGVNWDDVPWCSCNSRLASSARLKPGDIVFARTGATTGKSFLIRECPSEAVFASYLIRVRLKDDVDPLFISHFFRTTDYWRQITRSARGVAQPGVNATTLARLHVPLPPLGEQRRIAEILDKADALRAKRRAALAQLDTLTQSIFLDMFGDRSSILKRWTVRELGKHLTFLTSGSRGWANYYDHEGDVFLRIQNVRKDELLIDDIARVKAPQTGEAARTRVIPGDVLLSITADLGRTAVVPRGFPPAFINQHLAILRLTGVEPRFVSAFLSSPAGRLQVQARNRQGVKAGLNFDDIRSFLIPVPPLDTQRAFSRAAFSVDTLKFKARESELTASKLFASLQHRAFGGEL